MGALESFPDSVTAVFVNTSTPLIFASGLAAVCVLSVVLHILKQLLVKNPNEPPIVFSWLPFIGSTITYGIDPYKFFFSCREKVTIYTQIIMVSILTRL